VPKKAFTLVELIVVITILAILWTIAFVSFQWFSQDSRDSVRVSDINSINRSFKLHVTREWSFPIPDNANSITFSGATAWYQWVFGSGNLATVRQINKVPRDPLTGSLYAYSKTANANEYQLGAVLEGSPGVAFNFWVSQANAANEVGYSYIRWNYNKQFLSVNAGGTDYILAVPSIIASDILDSTALTIAANQAFAYHGTTNLPSSYSGSTFDTSSIDGFDFPAVASDIVVYSWSLAALSNPVDQTELVTNLQNVYMWTAVWASIDEILAIDVSSPEEINNFIALVTNTETGWLESVWLQRVAVSSWGGWAGTTDVFFYVGWSSAHNTSAERKVYASVDSWVNWAEVWTDAFPEGIKQCSAIYFNNKLLVIGGIGSDRVYSSSDGISWTDEAALPQAFQEFKAVELNNKLWVIGGSDGWAFPWNLSDKIFSSSDGITWIDSWITLPVATGTLQAVTVFNNKIWIIGGQTSVSAVATVYSFDGTTLLDESDSSVSNLLAASGGWGHAFVAWWNLVHVRGFSSTIESTSDGITWIDQTGTNAKSFPVATFWQWSDIVHNNSVYIVWGYSWSPGQDTVYQSSDGLDWSVVWNLPTGLWGWCAWKMTLTAAQVTALTAVPVVATATAVNDNGWNWMTYSSISLAANDTLCSSWVTTFSEQTAWAEELHTVNSFDPATWDITLENECNVGSFDYSILCDGVVTDTATVNMGWLC